MLIPNYKILHEAIGDAPFKLISEWLGFSSEEKDLVNKKIDEINKEYFFNKENNNIYKMEEDGSSLPMEMSKERIVNRYAAHALTYKPVKASGSRLMNPADIWMEHPNRLDVERIIFDPEKPPNLHQTSNGYMYNIWSGWPYDPVEGDWSLLREFLQTGAFNNNKENYEWFMKWLAFKIRFPHLLPEVAVVFYGIGDVGKSFLCEFILPYLFGAKYSLPSINLTDLNSNFNAKFQSKFYAHFCESNVAKIDKKYTGNVLKKMITSRQMDYEGKGKEAFTSDNYCVFVFTTNDPNGVPIERDIRRFAAFEFGEAYYKKDALFSKIEKEFTSGGVNALMYHLLKEIELNDSLNPVLDPLDDGTHALNVIKKLPVTETLLELEAFSENNYKKSLRCFIETGFINSGKVINDPNLEVYVSTEDFYEGIREKITNFAQEPRGYSVNMGKELKALCGPEWVEERRKKINTGFREKLKYSLRGSYAYLVSRQGLSDRHFELRKRRISILNEVDAQEVNNALGLDIARDGKEVF